MSLYETQQSRSRKTRHGGIEQQVRAKIIRTRVGFEIDVFHIVVVRSGLRKKKKNSEDGFLEEFRRSNGVCVRSPVNPTGFRET